MLSFYHFESVPVPRKSRDDLFSAVQNIPGLRGTVYIAKEGVNAQLAVPPGAPLAELLQACATTLPFDAFRANPPNLGDVVPITVPTFDRLVVRVRDFVLRDEIPVGNGETAPLDWSDAGPELPPADWHNALSHAQGNDTPPLILDCRNLYESEQGTFQGAIPLGTNTFQESWSTLNNMTKDLPKDRPLHIFCTGGIRCVKVGAYLKQQLGFSNVQRLQHGIIGYQKWIQGRQDADDNTTTSLWNGENFLFDKRRFADEGSDREHTE